MGVLSASQAAKRVGVSVPTITRALKKGKLSSTPREGGGYEIDESELLRVFPPKVTPDSDETLTKLGNDTDGKGNETPVLQARVDLLERLLDERADTIDDLRRRLDTSGEETRRLTALLTVEPSTVSKPDKRGLWARVMNKG
jgi:excisionase family DNA binding protein